MAKASRYPGVYSYEAPTKGKLWGCRWDEPTRDGVRKQRNKRGFRTQDAALAYLGQHTTRNLHGYAVSPTSTMRLDDYCEQWLTGQVDLSPGTFRNYRNRLLPVLAEIGHLPISRILPVDIDQAYAVMRRKGQSPSAVRYGHRILKQALRRAVVLEMIHANPCDRVTPPKSDTPEPDTWTQDEMRQFLASAITDPVWGDFWATLCETWLRIGELCDLRWQDIDSKQNAIRITHAVRRDAAMKLESGPVKTAKSRRTIPVSRPLIERLLMRRMRMGNPNAKALIFPSVKNGTWIEAHVARQALVRACEHAGVPVIGLHEVRHSGGSIAYRAGIDIKTISERLGHSDAAFTARVYVHLDDAHHKAAADVFWRLIAPPVSECVKSTGDETAKPA